MTFQIKLLSLVVILALFTSKNVIKGQNFMNINDEIITEFFETDALLVSALNPTDENLKCIRDLKYFWQQLSERRKWAMDMFDSWAKGPPSGVVYGNNINYGNFDQCLSVNHQIENENVHIGGKHCTVTVEIDDPQRKDTLVKGFLPKRPVYQDIRFLPQPTMNKSKLAISLGICLPGSCRSDCIYNLTSELLLTKFNMTMANYDQEKFCYGPKEMEKGSYEMIDYVTITLFTTMFIAILLSTIYELSLLRKGRRGNSVFQIFSAYKNGRKIFTSTTYKSPEILHCLNGIRVLSIVWIVFGHSYMTFVMNPLTNKRELKDWLESFFSCTVLGGSVAVDSFLLLSGVLVCWVILKDLKRGSRINIIKLYFHRYLRLAPSFAALLLVCLSVYRYFGSGPLWKKVLDSLVGPCQRNWWSTLLFVQNYYNPEDICLGHLWYLSVDMQLFILAPFVIYLLFKWGKKMFPFLSVLVLVSMGSAFYNSYRNEFRVSVVDNIIKGRTLAKGRLIFYPTHIRMGAYIIGLLLGYILFTMKNRQIRLPCFVVFCAWVLSITNCFIIVFGIYSFEQLDYDGSFFIDAIYESIIRVFWSLSLSWIIFACVHGYGSFINYFLSLSFWQPLGKLSYAIYLLHYPLQIYFMSVQREPEYFSNTRAIHKFWGDFMTSVCLAVIWVLAFEMPILGIQEIVFKGRRGENRSGAQIDQQKRQIVEETENSTTTGPVIDEEIGKT